MAKPATSLKAKALRLLAQREHGRLELRRRLLRHLANQAAATAEDADANDPGVGDALPTAPFAEVVDELLDWLTTHRYLDEARFVESRVHARSGRFGLRRIEAELAQRGASIDAGTVQRLRDTEVERARVVWTRRFGSVPQDAAERARQARFLAGRGFSSEAIRRVLRTD